MPNQLFYGDNLEVMRRHLKDESVDLCYIDPPFNSNRDYFQIYNNIGGEDRAQAQAFTDTWTWDTEANEAIAEILSGKDGRFPAQTIALIGGLKAVLQEGALLAYIVSMTLRVTEIHRVLKPSGSFYLHCDPTASHYLKLVLDSIFVTQGGDFKSEIIWKRSSAHNDAKQGRKQYGNIHDVIFFYTKSKEYIWNTQHTQYDDDYVRKTYNFTDSDGRRWKSSDMTGPGGAAKGNPQYEFLGITRYWRFSKINMQKLYDEGRIHQATPDAVPRMKHYLDEMSGVALQDVWTDVQPISARAAERLGYPTQKPEALLERIIAASSNEGDVVLDAYCGCGTTIAVAQRLKRHWIGIDITYQSIGVIMKRFIDMDARSVGEKIVDGIVLNGIPKDMDSARALTQKTGDKTRKEFEKWAVLTYSRHQAVINAKKGADGGVDGMQFFPVAFGSDEIGKVLYQVKSGLVGRKDIAQLRGDMLSQGAQLGVFLTLQEPTEPMRLEAAKAGSYELQLMKLTLPVITIATVRELIEERAVLTIPVSHLVNKTASAVKVLETQTVLDLSGE